MEARDANGRLVTQFSRPFTITVRYNDLNVAGISETGLNLYYFDVDSSTWVSIPTVVDTYTNTLTATVDHLTEFAVLGPPNQRIYLPLIEVNNPPGGQSSPTNEQAPSIFSQLGSYLIGALSAALGIP